MVEVNTILAEIKKQRESIGSFKQQLIEAKKQLVLDTIKTIQDELAKIKVPSVPGVQISIPSPVVPPSPAPAPTLVTPVPATLKEVSQQVLGEAHPTDIEIDAFASATGNLDKGVGGRGEAEFYFDFKRRFPQHFSAFMSFLKLGVAAIDARASAQISPPAVPAPAPQAYVDGIGREIYRSTTSESCHIFNIHFREIESRVAENEALGRKERVRSFWGPNGENTTMVFCSLL